jgi:multidrug efflux pump
MTRFFITRPIFASVLSIIIVLAGLVAAFKLPIAQYPQIAPPTVVITANYPGASAETLLKTVAAPIEEQLSGVDNLLYFRSTADSTGNLTITCTFEIGTNVDQATFNVSNRVNIASPKLPEDVRRTGVVVQKMSNDILLVVMLVSKTKEHDRLYLSNYSTLNILDELKRLKGVGDAMVFGSQDYSMRIWLKPDKMAQLGVSTSDIASAISAQNNQYAVGRIGQDPAPESQKLVYTVIAKGRLVEPKEFENIIVRANGPHGVLYLKDVASVELGGQAYNMTTALDGGPGVAIRVNLQVGANALETAGLIKQKMQELKEKFPSDMDYVIPYDTSDFVKATMQEVMHTFVEALILVVLVVFIFLQNWRATLIPIIAVPISLIGTFAGLYLCGFSINLLSLFAMILAIGIVVDDAIVVLENTERLMAEEGLDPLKAAVKSIEQVSAAVVAIVLVLCAVFVPVAFQGGIAGELYREFAITVAIAVVISGIVALTLTPTLCAMILTPSQAKGRFFDVFNRGFSRLSRFYQRNVSRIIEHKFLGASIFTILIVAVVSLLKIVPYGFVPPEDQGYVVTVAIMPDNASLTRTTRTLEQVRAAVSKDISVAHTFAINGLELLTGASKTNAGTMFVRLTDWKDRKVSAEDMVNKIKMIGLMQPDGMALAVNPPSIRGLGSAGGFEVFLQTQKHPDPIELAKVLNNFLTVLRNEPRLVGINSFFRPSVPQLSVEVDEAKALTQNVRISDIYATLQSTMGSYYVNDFTRNGRTYRVQLQAEPQYRMTPEDLGKVYVRSQPTPQSPNGNMIPLSALSTVKYIIGAEQLERYNGLLSAKIFGSGAPGISSGQAIEIVNKLAKANLPEGYKISWTEQAFQEIRTGNAAMYAFAFAIIMVFLILAAQFEKWSLPLAVIMAVPFAMLGALFAVMLRGMPNDIYFQIGLITLIGLAAKNAILIVEFAEQKMEEGLHVKEAAIAAAKLRFRPIVMTSMAFVLGILPLVFATGAGAAARRSMGTGVFGGMILATFVATIFVPLFFTWLSGNTIRHHGHIAELEVDEKDTKR